nr:MAG TPA: hypothetical protein [Caudoviricetes sp.]
MNLYSGLNVASLKSTTSPISRPPSALRTITGEFNNSLDRPCENLLLPFIIFTFYLMFFIQRWSRGVGCDPFSLLIIILV